MPREYSNRPTGPRTPDPLAFGASDINLQTPQFRAQTNVDPGVNVFAQLQEIIGMSVGVVKQRIDMDTEALKNKISYENAVAAEKERTEREKVIAFTAEAASRREIAAASEDLPALKEQQSRLVGVLKDPNTSNEEKIAASQQLQAMGVDIGRVTADKEQAERSSLKLTVDAAAAVGDLSQIEAIQNSILLAKKNGTITKTQSSLLDYVTDVKNQVARETEATVKQDEVRAGKAAAEAMDVPLANVIGRLSEDPKFLVKLAESGTSIEGPLFDEIRDSLISEYPDMAELFYYGSEEESKAAALAIGAAAKDLAKKAIGARTVENLNKAYDNAVVEAESTAISGGIVNAVRAIESDPRIRGVAATNEAIRRASASYVKAGLDPVDRLVRAQNVAENPETAAAGAKLYSDQVKAIRNDIDQRRDGTRDINEIEYGWTKQYPTPELFLEHVLSSFGYSKIEDVPDQVRGTVLGLMGQYERDYNARTTAAERIARSAAATSGKNRSKTNPNDVYESLDIFPLTQDLNALGKLTAFQLEDVVRQATTGFSNNEVPGKLLDFMVENADDERTFALQDAFWSVHQGESQWLAAKVAGSRSLMRSRMVGLAVGMERKRGTNQSVRNNNVLEMLKNLDARTSAGTSAMDENEKSEFAKIRKEQETSFIQTIADSAGVKLNGSWFSIDDLDLSPAEVMSRMESSDRARLTMYMDAASAYPASAGDRNALAMLMMQSDGYTLIADNGAPNLVYNPVVRRGGSEYRVLPDYQTMQSKEWKSYVDSHKDRAAEWISANNEKGLRIGADAVESIQISFSDFDAGFYGGVGVSVKLRNEPFPVQIPTEQLTIDSQGFKAWKRFENDLLRTIPTTSVPGLEGLEYLGGPEFRQPYEVE